MDALTNLRSAQWGAARSAKPALSPYFVEEVAMTRSEILRVRDADVFWRVEPVPAEHTAWAGSAAA